MAVCVGLSLRPVSGLHLVAWIELNRILGVNHFVFYSYEITRDMARALAYYRKQQLVTVLEWNLHVNLNTTSSSDEKSFRTLYAHIAHQVAANNDCLNRVGNVYRYLLFLDLNELVIPFIIDSLPGLLHSTDDDDIAEFLFPSTRIRDDMGKDEAFEKSAPDLKNAGIPFLDFTHYETQAYQQQDSKVAVKFHQTRRMGLNYAMDTTGSTHSVPSHSALLFRYLRPDPEKAPFHEVERSKRLAYFRQLLLPAIRHIKDELNAVVS